MTSDDELAAVLARVARWTRDVQRRQNEFNTAQARLSTAKYWQQKANDDLATIHRESRAAVTNHHLAEATRRGQWWEITVDGLDEVTQSRRLSRATLMARELVAVTTNTRLDDVVVNLDVKVPGVEGVLQRSRDIGTQRAKADRLLDQAADESERLAAELSAEGVPLRDIGTLLGVSFQRVHQILNGQ